MQKVTELTGHKERVLHMATSPDGTTVVSAGADETLRFWRVFGTPPRQRWRADTAARSTETDEDEGACRSLLATTSIR